MGVDLQMTILTVQQQIFANFVLMSAVAIFVYDYFLTLPREIRLIWFSRWTYTKVLFLLVRYLTFADTFLLICNRAVLNVSATSCSSTYLAALWLVTLKITLAESILAIRTWAVWHQSKVVCVILVIITLGNLAVQCVFMTISTLYINGGIQATNNIGITYSNIYFEFVGCFVVFDGLSLRGSDLPFNYMALTGVEAIILVLMMISAFRLYRVGAVSELLQIIHRDGILFYIVLLGITAANVGIGISPGMNTNAMLLTPMEEVLYSVLTTRIVLNIRGAACNPGGVQTELHTSLPIAFAVPDRTPPGYEHTQESTA